MTLTNIKSVLNFVAVPSSELDTATMVEWAAQGLSMIQTQTMHKPELTVLELDDHIAILPNDLKYISAVVYSGHNPKTSVIETEDIDTTTLSTTSSSTAIPANADVTITTTTSRDNANSTVDTTTTTIQYPASFTREMNDGLIGSINYQAVLNNYQDYGYLANDAAERYQLLKLDRSAFAASIHSNCTPNFTSSCYSKYTIDSKNRIVCDYRNGYLSVFYLSVPKNEEGDLMIPDDGDVKLALAAYIHMKYQQMQTMMHVQGAAQLYQEFRREWQLMAAKVKGKQVYNEIDRDRMAYVTRRGFSYANNPKVFDNWGYYNNRPRNQYR